MPYANRVLHLDFPELSAEGDPVWIKMRNPKFLSPAEIRGRKARPAGDEQADTDAEENSSYELFAKLIIGWHVYDAADNDDNPPPLGMPATAASVAKLPVEILNRLGEELAKANPRKRTEPQEATTGS
jgi:hypothetical protein